MFLFIFYQRGVSCTAEEDEPQPYLGEYTAIDDFLTNGRLTYKSSNGLYLTVGYDGYDWRICDYPACFNGYHIVSAGSANSLNPADYLAKINRKNEISGWGTFENDEWIDLQLSVSCSSEPEMLESTTSVPGMTNSGPSWTRSGPDWTKSGPNWTNSGSGGTNLGPRLTKSGPNWTNLGPSRTNSGPCRTKSGPNWTGPGQSTSGQFWSPYWISQAPGRAFPIREAFNKKSRYK